MNQKDKAAIEGIIKELKALVRESKPRARKVTQSKAKPFTMSKSARAGMDGKPQPKKKRGLTNG